jgi:transposase
LGTKLATNPAQVQYQRESAQSAQAQAGTQALFAAVLYHRRFTGERTFAWEEKFKRLLLRFETKPRPHLGFKLLAFTLINLRAFCGG